MWSEIISLRMHRDGPLEPDPVDTGVGKGTASVCLQLATLDRRFPRISLTTRDPYETNFT